MTSIPAAFYNEICLLDVKVTLHFVPGHFVPGSFCPRLPCPLVTLSPIHFVAGNFQGMTNLASATCLIHVLKRHGHFTVPKMTAEGTEGPSSGSSYIFNEHSRVTENGQGTN
jgi:hypothetical protein